MNSTLPILEVGSVHGPHYSIEERRAFLAARDVILRQAEVNTTQVNLRRAAAANEFAHTHVAPIPTCDQPHSLPLAEALREEKRCNAVRVRLAELRLRLRRPAA